MLRNSFITSQPGLSSMVGLRAFSGTAATFARAKTTAPKVETTAEIKRQIRALPKLNVPKRPGTPFSLFIKDNYAEARKPGEKITAVMGILAQKWKTISPQAKAKYETQFARAKEAYAKDVKAFEKKVTPEQALVSLKLRNLKSKLNPKALKAPRLIDPNRPKRPLPPYMMFVSDVMAASPDVQAQVLGKPSLELSLSERGKALGAAWKRIPDDRKELYVNQYSAEKAKYEKLLAAYNKDQEVDAVRSGVESTLKVAKRGRVVKKVARKKTPLKKKAKKVVKKKVIKKKVIKKATKKPAAKKAAKKTTAKKPAAKKTVKKVVKKVVKKPVARKSTK